MSLYLPMLFIHITCVVLSISFFIVRGIWMIKGSSLLAHPVVRIAPHVIDTLLLASAIGLAMMLEQYPFVHNWLTVKVFALIGYIVLGTIALKRGKTMRIRILAFASAILLFAYIVSVAWFHDPMGAFSLFC